jgi:hypothetical protein
MLKIIRLWLYWNKKRKGLLFCDHIAGPGFYRVNSIKELEMKSGRIGLYRCKEYKLYRDPEDMIEFSQWDFIGYKGLKKIKDCNFHEFLKIYC